MTLINVLRFSITIIALVFIQSCDSDTINSKDASQTYSGLKTITAETLDSLSIALGKTNDSDDYRLIEILLNSSRIEKDSLILAKTEYFISYLYFISKNYEEAKIHSLNAELIGKRSKSWEEMGRAITHQSRIFRQKKELDSIEPLLKNGFEEINSADPNHFAQLYPIHELAVYYSYDRADYKKAIEYGEFFFNKLAYFDSLQVENRNFNEIKEYRKDVIDLTLGVSYLKLGQLEKSYKHLNKALINYTKRNDTEKLNRVHKAFIEYYLYTGDKEKLIYHKEEYYNNTLKYINSFSESQKEINALKIKLIEDERALEILKEEAKSKTLLTYIAVVGLLIFGLFRRYNSKLLKEKREVALQLKKQYEFNQFKTNLLITIAHELRTPLTIILGHLQLISDNKIEPEKFKQYFNKIKGSSESILNKMSDIIHLLKEDNTNTPTVLKTIQIQPFLKGLFFGFEGVARVKKIKLIYTSQLNADHTLKTDAKILSGLLNNLIVNAIKFSTSNSKVEMRVHYNENKLIIATIDEGIGISNKDQKKIFDKFNRVNAPSKADGFGLGLAIVKKSTQQLNGTIDLKSTLGEGSTFTLTLPNELPITTVEKLPLSTSKFKNGGLNNTGNPQKSKVLIVEDNPEMSSFYEHVFDPLFDCTFAFNGIEGLEILQKKTFDIIVSDVMMPKMDGFEFKEKIRAIPRLMNIPFVLVTAKAQDESKIQAFDIGVDDYVVKPFNKNELIARMKALIANKKEREKWSLSRKGENTTENETFDVKTVRKLRETVLQYCGHENFNVTDLAREIGLSQRQLVRVTKKLTGLTPVKFILEVRLLEAYKKIKNQEEADINNVRFAVGIQSASYFSTQFKKRFGLNPTELVQNNQNQFIDFR